MAPILWFIWYERKLNNRLSRGCFFVLGGGGGRGCHALFLYSGALAMFTLSSCHCIQGWQRVVGHMTCG